jgi:hypothetical protein
MAETLNDSLVKVTEELKEANDRSLQATKELGKVTAATKASYKEVGDSVKESLGINKLKDMVASLPGMNIAKAVGGIVMKKRREKQEQMNLAKRLGITRDQLLLQKAEQEVVLAKEEESKKLIEAAEKLGFNTDRIERVNEEGNVELNGSLRESNGQFVSKANASADAQLRALKDFSGNQEKSLSESVGSMVSAPDVGISGASASEDAAEDRRLADAQLGEQEKQTSLLQQLVDGGLGEKGDEKEKGGFLDKLASLRLALMGLPALLAGKLAALKLGARAVAGSVARGAGAVARGAGTVARGVAGSVARGAGTVARGAGTVARGVAGSVGTVAKGAGGIAKVAGKGLLRGAAGAAKFIPGIGLAVTAAMGIFDGMSAGIEEYKKSGKLGAAVKEGIAGAASGLTFGLVSQESISAGMDKIGTFFSDGWTSFTDGVGKVAGGIAAFAKDPAGTMSAVGESISTKFTETVTSIKEGATALNTKFTELTGIDIGAGFTATVGLIKDGATALGNKFTELTGIEIPTDFASLKTSIVAGASLLGTKFTELTGIDIGETFTGLKDKVLGVATGLNTKFAEVTGINIGETLSGVKESVLGLGTKISEGFTGLFGEEGFSVAGIKTAISGIGSAISGKFTELTGVNLPTFEDVKSGMLGIGTSITGGLAALGVPTFSEVTGQMGALATGLASRVGIELPTFDEAKNAVGDLAAGLGSKISGMWDSVTGLFKSADEKQAQIDQRNALEEAKESGLYTERGLRKSLIDDSQLAGASDVQLQAILSDDDLSSDNMEKVQAELASRTSAEPTVETASSSFDGSTEVRRKNGQIEMMNLDQIDTSVNLKKITNMEANAARNRISEEKSTRPVPQTISADAKQDVLSAMGNDTTPLGMGSESITNSVVNSAATASATTSNLTYVPSKMAPLPTGSVSTTQLGAGALMQAEVVQLHAQRTTAIQEQSQVNVENAAMAPVAMMTANSQQIVNNVTNQSSKTMMIPVPVSDPNVESWNPMNGR